MPFSDPEQKREFMKEYWPQYLEENREEIEKRKASWYQQNKDHARVRDRRNKHLRRHAPAFAAVGEAWKELAKALVRARAERPDLPVELLRGIALQFPTEEWEGFVESVPGVRDRNFWKRLREVENE